MPNNVGIGYNGTAAGNFVDIPVADLRNGPPPPPPYFG